MYVYESYHKSPHRLPRRESERRNHPLIRHCDVLTAIETRISLLQMTFMKYVDAEVSHQVWKMIGIRR